MGIMLGLKAAYDFVTSPLGKILGIIAGVIILLITIGIIYHKWSDSIREAEDLRITVQNQQAIIIQKDKMMKQLNDIEDIKAAVGQQQTTIDHLADQVQDRADDGIDKAPATADKPAGDVLKQTFRDLYGARK